MWIDLGIYATYALIGIGILAILIFSLAKVAKDPAGAKSALVGIVGLLVVGGLAYALSTGSDATTVFKKLEISEGTSHWVGTGLIGFYILAALAILSILYVEVSRLFK